MNLESFCSQAQDRTITDAQDKTKDHINFLIPLIEELKRTDSISGQDYKFITTFLKAPTVTHIPRVEQIYENIKCSSQLSMNSMKKFNKYYKKLLEHFKLDPQRVVDYYSRCNPQFNFTEEQLVGLDKIIKFLSGPDKVFGFYGYAGSGKTTTLIKFSQYLIYDNLIKSIALAAPTNKAVNVMKAKFSEGLEYLGRQKFNETNISVLDTLKKNQFKVEFLTLHRLLNYKNSYKMSGTRVFVKGNKSKVTEYHLVIIDECSMLSLQSLMDIFEEIHKHSNIKIVFLGDPAQLPPVNERSSLIFADSKECFSFKDFETMFIDQANLVAAISNKQQAKERFGQFQNFILNMDCITLHSIVRSRDPEVINLSYEIRQFVLGEIKCPKFYNYKKSPKISIYRCGKENRYKKTTTKWFQKYVKSVSEAGVDSSHIILTWVNKQSDTYNNTIRERLYSERYEKGPNKQDIYEVGDILIMSDFYSTDDSNDTEENKFYTSEQIKITNIERIIKSVSGFSENLDNKTSQLKNIHDIKDKYVKAIKNINRSTKRKYKVWKLTVVKLNTDGVHNHGNIGKKSVIYIVEDSSLGTLKDDITLANNKIKELIGYYKSIHISNLHNIDNLIIGKLWKEFNSKFVDQFAQVNYGYSITVHKSQASTFYNVYVDLEDIFRNTNLEEAKKCLYTAATRTSNELHILI